MRISDWSSDVCSSDLRHRAGAAREDGLIVAAVARIAGLVALDVGRQRHDAVRLQRRQQGAVAAPEGDGDLAALALGDHLGGEIAAETGRAAGRERVCQYGETAVVGVGLIKKK